MYIYTYVDEIGRRQVSEAEKLRHGQKAATVTGLENESTGDVVDMGVPARRCAPPRPDRLVHGARRGGRGT